MRNTDADTSPWYGKGFLPQSTSSADSLTVSVQTPCDLVIKIPEYTYTCVSIAPLVSVPTLYYLYCPALACSLITPTVSGTDVQCGVREAWYV